MREIECERVFEDENGKFRKKYLRHWKTEEQFFKVLFSIINMSSKLHNLGLARRALGQLTWNASYTDGVSKPTVVLQNLSGDHLLCRNSQKLLLTGPQNDEKESWCTPLTTGFSNSITDIMYENRVEQGKSEYCFSASWN